MFPIKDHHCHQLEVGCHGVQFFVVATSTGDMMIKHQFIIIMKNDVSGINYNVQMSLPLPIYTRNTAIIVAISY